MWNETALPWVRVRPASHLGLVALLCLCLFPVASPLDPQLPEAGAASPPSPPAAVRPWSEMGLHRCGRKLQGKRDKTPGQGEGKDRAASTREACGSRGLGRRRRPVGSADAVEAGV